MKKNWNLFLSCFSLLVTTFLLVVTLMAWYSSNKIVTATGLVAQAEEDGASYELYVWTKTSPKWTLVSDDISVTAKPNDIIYFKLVATGLNTTNNFSARFQGISSVLNDKVVTATYIESDYTVYYNNVPMYQSKTSSIVVEDDNTLYTITEETVEETTSYVVGLDDYLIEDVFVLYNAPVITGSDSDSNDTPTGKGSNKLTSLTSEIFNYKPTLTSEIEYFALSFDSTGDDDVDNYYQYQGLSIKQLLMSN